MGKPSAPEPPDPQETSAAQTGTNVSTSIANNIMGMVDQTTPQGSLTYTQIGDYSWTDPYTGESYTIPRYRSDTQLTPEAQAVQDANLQTQQNLADTAAERSGFLQDYLSSGGLDANAVDDKLYEYGAARLDPRFEQQREALSARLANQGIAPGSEAYNREMQLLGQNENDAYNQLMLTGRGTALNEVAAMRNQPINEIIGLLSGTQVQNPSVSLAQPTQMPTTDNAALINTNYQQQYNNYQTQLAQSNSLLGGLFSLGAGLI